MKGYDVLETNVKKQAAMLGGRIGFIFLIASSLFIFVAYFILSQNFQGLLTDYTIKLVQAMLNQGVTTVEYELRAGQDEAAMLADSFTIPPQGEDAVFPSAVFQPDILRAVYVSQDGTFASDGRALDVRGREDIIKAFSGETAVYGPYFNEKNEYVVCYSAPVKQNGKIAGVLSIEKDGYYFCTLIKDIRFINSGESYIINAEGTDIAVSNLEHIDWVNSQYNARRILEAQMDDVTLSILQLEQKGLDGETGVGTYYWDDGLVYVAYAPIPSVQWVLLGGLRQEEIDAMTQSVLYTSITKGPAFGALVIIFFSLTALIIFWILSSMRKTAEINEKLNVIANYDALTGTKNRNSFHAKLDAIPNEKYRALACIYIDVNGLHEINNHLGHQAGDQMLQAVADVLHRLFLHNDIYRIGGDEFVIICKNLGGNDVLDKMNSARQSLKAQGYEISVGIEWREKDIDVNTMISMAEEAMQRDKQRYYQENGKERQMRALDRGLEQIMLQKQDADAFFSILSSEFKGVYFVDLGLDTIRHLYIPSYFEEMLKEADNVFSNAMKLYIHRVVAPEYRKRFEQFSDYGYVEGQLGKGAMLEFIYQKTDGSRLKLRILKFKTYTAQRRETLWIFSNAGE